MPSHAEYALNPCYTKMNIHVDPITQDIKGKTSRHFIQTVDNGNDGIAPRSIIHTAPSSRRR